MTMKLRKILWHTSIVLLTLAIFVLAITALYRLIKSIHITEVIDAISQISIGAIVLATIIVAVGYLVLTLYDAIAFKHMKVELAAKKVVLTSFTAYAIGHTVGLAVLSAAGVRYRMYRSQGIDAEYIANVIWLVSMAFTFGISTLVALSLTFNPDTTVVMLAELDAQLLESAVSIPKVFRNPELIRGLGITVLAAIVGIVAWSGKFGRHVKVRGWRFDLPPATILIKQILISIVDLASVAFVLYILLPQDLGISFPVVFSAFIQSMILAILSHVPGGLGVFELTMIASLPQVDKAYLLGVLLIFRLLYYILPFILALIFFVLHEIWLRSKKT